MLDYVKSRAKIYAIAVAIGVWFSFTVFTIGTGNDWLLSFRPASLGNLQHVVIPYWGLFLSWIPAHLPEPIGYGLWTGIGLILIIIAAMYTQAPLPAILLSYQFIWVLFYGQIDGYVIFGIVMGLWAVRTSRPGWAGVALMVAMVKPQIGFLPALMMFWWSPDRKKTLMISGLILTASLVAWPKWVFDIVQYQWINFLSREENIMTNTSAHFPMVLSLLLIFSSFYVRLDRKQKLVALVATSMLTAPYSTIYSQLTLLVMGLPAFFYIFAFIPWGVAILIGPFDYWSWGYIFPLGVWLYLVGPPLWSRVHEVSVMIFHSRA